MGTDDCAPRQARIPVALARALTIAAVLASGAASAQQAHNPDQTAPSADEAHDPNEIVVTGQRRSAAGDIEPLATLDADAIAATGATTMSELIRALRPLTQSGGSDPILLLDGERVSGYQVIGSLPPEAIEKVDVLPESAALKFGYPPTRIVLNFITKRRFQQVEIRGIAGGATRGGNATRNANAGTTWLRSGRRFTANVERRHSSALFQSERNLASDPDIFFDGVGNITAVNGREIDPALSALAGKKVTVAPVPQGPGDPTNLGSYAPAANRPRLFDLGPYRTLAPRDDAWKVESVLADRLGAVLGSLSLSAEQSRNRTMAGPAAAKLLVPETNPFSPFSGPVLLHRYLTETDPLRLDQTTTTLHAGGALQGVTSGWHWDFTTVLDQQLVKGSSERGIDLTAANAAIASGANPFAPLDASLLADRLVDHGRMRTRTMGAKTVVTNTPLRLPAGVASVTGTVEAERIAADSSTRGANPFDLHLARTRTEAGIAVDLPLTSRRKRVLPFVGDLSVNASGNVRQVGGFGTLYDRSYGVVWGPIEGVQILLQDKTTATAPAMAQLSTPVVRIPNSTVFDFGTGRNELVTLIMGGNPDLDAERRHVRSFTVNFKPFPKRELRLTATYEATDIRDQTGNVYALTPVTEAIFPDRFVRDLSGRLVSVSFQPTNFYRQRQRTLNMTLSSSGPVGGPAPETKPGGPARPKQDRPTYYGGIGPSIKFSDRLQLRPGTPELDLLRGDTVLGGGVPRISGYAYVGINYRGNGLSFDGWYGGRNRVRSDNPAGDLFFSPILRLNMSAYVSVDHFLKEQEWTRKMQVRVEVGNLTNAHQRVRDRNGEVPSRFQPDFQDPVGRTVKLSVRKLL
jgi:iron complex outermembrane receptor protein